MSSPRAIEARRGGRGAATILERPSALLLSDPVVAQVPVDDCGEELVEMREVPELLGAEATKHDFPPAVPPAVTSHPCGQLTQTSTHSSKAALG